MMLAWGALLNAEERGKLVDVAAAISCDPSDLSACIYFESRWDPAALNAASGASGLIQFMPGPRGSAVALGTTTDAIRQMTRVEQLDLVHRYFTPYIGRVRTLSDLYMAILWPRAVGKPEEYALFSADDADARAYVQNKGLDLNRDGTITKAEATSFVARRLTEGLLPQNAADAETQPAAPIEEHGRPLTTEAVEPTLKTGLKFAPEEPNQEAPMLPLIIPFVLSLAQSFLQPKIAQTLVKQGVTPDVATSNAGAITQAGTALLSGIVDSAVKNTGQEDAVAAAKATGDQLALAKAQIEALTLAKADADARAKVEADSTALLDKVKPLIDQLDTIQRGEWAAEEDSRDRAAARAKAEPWDMTKTLVYAGIGFLALVTVAVFTFYGIALWFDKSTAQFDTLIVQLVTAIIGIVLTIIAYRFGTSRSSSAKDELVAQLSARRPGATR